MDARDPETDDAATQEAPPAWVLRTPTRRREVWPYPVLALVLAAASVVFGVALGGVLGLVLGVTAAVVTTVGAVVLFVTGWRAYDEQTRAAAWRSHVSRVVVAATSVPGSGPCTARPGRARPHRPRPNRVVTPAE